MPDFYSIRDKNLTNSRSVRIEHFPNCIEAHDLRLKMRDKKKRNKNLLECV